MTFTVVDWLPVFVSEAACKIVTNSLNFCHQNKGLRTNAYATMPTHLHAIVFHETFAAPALEAVLTDFRKFTGRQLADYCQARAAGSGDPRRARPCRSAERQHNYQPEVQTMLKLLCGLLTAGLFLAWASLALADDTA